MKTSIGTSSKLRNWFLYLGLHHFNPPYQGNLTRKRKAWEREPMVSPRTKGCRLKYARMGHNYTKIYFLSPVLLLHYFQVAQYIAPQWEVKGWVRAFPGIWKAKSQVICYLMRKNSIFLAPLLIYASHNGEICVYTRSVSCWPAHTHKMTF